MEGPTGDCHKLKGNKMKCSRDLENKARKLVGALLLAIYVGVTVGVFAVGVWIVAGVLGVVLSFFIIFLLIWICEGFSFCSDEEPDEEDDGGSYV